MTTTKTHKVRMWCEGGASEYTTVEAATLEEAERAALEEAEAWTADSDWGDDGVSVDYGYQILGEDDEPIAEGSGTFECAADQDALIRAAGGEPDCEDGDGHDWTSEGEGGCRENPGVWSKGGTTIVYASHCRKCGLRRVETCYGSQRNPHQLDTTEYTMPESAGSDD